MRIALRRSALRVTQQLANDRQAKPGAGSHGSVSVAQIVDADASQARFCPGQAVEDRRLPSRPHLGRLER